MLKAIRNVVLYKNLQVPVVKRDLALLLDKSAVAEIEKIAHETEKSC